jgi:hypothetical protein
MDKKLQKMFNTSTFSISKESFHYCKVDSYPTNPSDHFFISKDADEITVVTERVSKVENLIQKDDNEWLLVSLNLSTPFMKGTLFNVSKAIYESDSNILIVSTYSKDLLFIKKQDKKNVITALEGIGFKYVE